MKKLYFILAGLILAGAVGAIFTATSAPTAAQSGARKIVVFKQGVVPNEMAKDSLVKKFGAVKIKNLKLVNGMAVYLSPRAEKDLAAQADVLRIDDDVIVQAMGKPAPIQPAQVTPWGVSKINAPLTWSFTNGAAIKVAVLDTGIDTKHPDLLTNLKGGFSAVSYTTSYNDDNGHGTHVAGAIAAANNTIGVVGVAPQAELYAIKALDRRGSGYLSDVIEGLDWAVANGIQVVNMSLGTASDIQSLHDAVIRANAAGIVQVAAAGNESAAVIFPAAYPEVIAVAATDSANAVAYFSNYGPAVDLAAPGVKIYSTYKGQTYATLSGTSMATPHVSGAAALLLSVPAKCDLDLDGRCSPAEVQQRLEATAIDLGAAGKDNFYGSGLVDVYRAVTQ